MREGAGRVGGDVLEHGLRQLRAARLLVRRDVVGEGDGVAGLPRLAGPAVVCARAESDATPDSCGKALDLQAPVVKRVSCSSSLGGPSSEKNGRFVPQPPMIFGSFFSSSSIASTTCGSLLSSLVTNPLTAATRLCDMVTSSVKIGRQHSSSQRSVRWNCACVRWWMRSFSRSAFCAARSTSAWCSRSRAACRPCTRNDRMPSPAVTASAMASPEMPTSIETSSSPSAMGAEHWCVH